MIDSHIQVAGVRDVDLQRLHCLVVAHACMLAQLLCCLLQLLCCGVAWRSLRYGLLCWFLAVCWACCCLVGHRWRLGMWLCERRCQGCCSGRLC